MINMDWGTLPTKEELEATGDFPMVIKSQDEWAVIATAINQGIDAHLEAVFTTEADATTGRITIEARSLHTFLRRLLEQDSEEAEDLASRIVDVLGWEWT